MTAPTLDPIDAVPMAIGRFVVKLVDITARAGMYEIPPPMPMQKPWARSTLALVSDCFRSHEQNLTYLVVLRGKAGHH